MFVALRSYCFASCLLVAITGKTQEAGLHLGLVQGVTDLVPRSWKKGVGSLDTPCPAIGGYFFPGKEKHRLRLELTWRSETWKQRFEYGIGSEDGTGYEKTWGTVTADIRNIELSPVQAWQWGPAMLVAGGVLRFQYAGKVRQRWSRQFIDPVWHSPNSPGWQGPISSGDSTFTDGYIRPLTLGPRIGVGAHFLRSWSVLMDGTLGMLGAVKGTYMGPAYYRFSIAKALWRKESPGPPDPDR
jgi:hypothetical protein